MAIKLKETGNLTCEVTCNTDEEWATVIGLANHFEGKVIDVEDSFDYCPYKMTISEQALTDEIRELLGGER